MKKRPRPVPAWDDYFMALCFIIASRSKDPSTQHGAIIVDAKHRIQGTGYNGPPSLIADNEIDWNRPAKYPFIVHAECNAIDQTSGGPDALEGSTIYITGMPCSECTKRIISKKIRKIIFGPQNSNMVNQEDWQETKELVRLSRIVLERYTGNLNWLRDRMAWMGDNMKEVFEPQTPLPI
jgi:dCMP deaminase